MATWSCCWLAILPIALKCVHLVNRRYVVNRLWMFSHNHCQTVARYWPCECCGRPAWKFDNLLLFSEPLPVFIDVPITFVIELQHNCCPIARSFQCNQSFVIGSRDLKQRHRKLFWRQSVCKGS